MMVDDGANDYHYDYYNDDTVGQCKRIIEIVLRCCIVSIYLSLYTILYAVKREDYFSPYPTALTN